MLQTIACNTRTIRRSSEGDAAILSACDDDLVRDMTTTVVCSNVITVGEYIAVVPGTMKQRRYSYNGPLKCTESSPTDGQQHCSRRATLSSNARALPIIKNAYKRKTANLPKHHNHHITVPSQQQHHHQQQCSKDPQPRNSTRITVPVGGGGGGGCLPPAVPAVVRMSRRATGKRTHMMLPVYSIHRDAGGNRVLVEAGGYTTQNQLQELNCGSSDVLDNSSERYPNHLLVNHSPARRHPS